MIPAKTTKNELALRSTKAIDQRRAMLEIPKITEVLNSVELTIFKASTKTPISQLPERTMIEHISALCVFIRKDIGLRQEIDQYDKTRLFDILRKYFSSLTLDEVKAAFELASVGQLDSYLPKNNQGEPDKSHYQSFSVEYVSKILTAYNRRKSHAITKAYAALPERIEISSEQKLAYRKRTLLNIYKAFLKYKYTGKLEASTVTEYLSFEELIKTGFIETDLPITDDDRKAAYAKMMQKSISGLINKFAAETIRKLGTEHSDVKNHAYLIARKQAVKKAFDRIIRDEIQLIDFLKM